ncbi:unnamed protein product [Meganyctiphanes norvegica]|uniref:Hemocyanin n=1 Tax=Meganyctiphanes norvegica TaxID=48144 RepID=A0AAV2R9A6_MEGNR
MKVFVSIALGLLGLVVAAQAVSVPQMQQDVNAFLTKTTGPLRTSLLGDLAGDFSPTADASAYNDGGKAAQRLVQEVNDGRTLKQKNFFSLFTPKHREEALMLFEVFINCKNWDPCIRNNAAYFRSRMNEGVFTYAVYVGVIHHPVAKGVVLPPLYEITPHMFTNSEVINKAYTAKMTQTPGKFTMGYTGSQKNPEQRVAYFGEDIGMNVHHVSWHMDYPFWWQDKFGYSMDRKGELFFWVHHQLTARFDAERLSNEMNFVDELYWDRPIVEGFAPHTTYKYGGEFPARPDNTNFEDVEGVAKIRDLMIWEDRIRDAIAHGYVTASDGTTIDILNDKGIDILGDLIESSTYSVNPYYYGALHNTAHIVLGRQGDPKGKFKQPPGVMEHFETATRDPAFFRLHKYMNNIFKEFKDRLPSYSKEDFLWEGVELETIEIEGSLETFFEDFEFSIGNAVDDSQNVADVSLTAVVKRLNHKPFSFKMQVNNNKGAAAVASARIYMCPRRDANGVAFHPNSGRWGCIEMDKFYVELAPGANTVIRPAEKSTVTIPDIPSFDFMKEKTDAAVAAGADATGLEEFGRSCGIPNRLLLPKGKENGLEMVLMAFLEDGEADKADDFTIDVNSEFGGTHAHCGIRGQKVPDKRALGYPLDRSITDFRMTAAVPNFKTSLVNVYHKPSD